MSKIDPKSLKPEGRGEIVIRAAIGSDAHQTVGLIKHSLEASDFLIHQPHEFTRTPYRERHNLKRKLAAPDEIVLVAEAAGEIVAMLDGTTEKRYRLRHSIEFGLVVHDDWQRLGIGRAMLHSLLEWARRTESLERVQLHVTEGNEPAIRLYEDLGFVIEGTRKRAIRYEGGGYRDDILMCYYLTPLDQPDIIA